MFFEVFRIQLPSWYHAFLDDRRLTRESTSAAPPGLVPRWC